MFMSSLGFQTPLELNLRKKPIFALENYKLFHSLKMSIFFNSRDYQLKGPRRALDAELMPTLLQITQVHFTDALIATYFISLHSFPAYIQASH
jgi:hypothetical protein